MIATTPTLSVAQIARQSPPTKDGRPVHPSTVNKWITRGVKLPDKSILKLRAIRYPGGWSVSPDDLDQFLATLTAVALGEDAPESDSAPAPIAARRRRELDAVDRQLEADGLGM